MPLTSRIQAEDGALVTVLPEEVVRHLALEVDQALYWRQAGLGACVVP